MRTAHTATALDELQAASQALTDAIGRFDAAGWAARAVGAGWRDIAASAGFSSNTVWNWWSGRKSSRRPQRLAADTFRRRSHDMWPAESLEDLGESSPALRRLRRRVAAEKVNGR